MLVWIALWVVVFSGMDFWGIRIWRIQRAERFTGYRTAMHEYAWWISPASSGLA